MAIAIFLFSLVAGAAPAGLPADLSDLPLVEVPSQGRSPMLAVLVSGDGGWAAIDRSIASVLAASGIPVVGLNSLQYFWKGRNPQTASRDLDRILRHYLKAWQKEKVVLVGYSRGADVLPFMVNRLAPDLSARISLIGLLGLSSRVQFEFHLSDWLTDPSKGFMTLPELEKLRGRNVVCIYGDDEKDSICRAQNVGKAIALHGSHHFDGNYDELGKLLLQQLP
jgi:type IV secretory pathway VirJ component